MDIRSKLIVAACSLAAAAVSFAQTAQPAFPSKTVTIVVPFPAGAGTDFLARTLAQRLQSAWKQSVIVENVPGANSSIGAQRVAQAAPDGHTLMLTTDSTVTSNRLLYKSLPYDPDKSFVPVTQVAYLDMFVIAHSGASVNSLKDAIEQARREPGKVSFASWGKGSHADLLFSLVGKREGTSLMHVPYKGTAPALLAVMSGESLLTLTGRRSGAAAISSGKVKVLAYMSDARDPAMPGVPTTAEAGYPYVRVPLWYGLFAPAGTPREIVDRIQRDAAALLKEPDYKQQVETNGGYRLVMATPEKTAAAIREDIQKTSEMVKAAGLTAQ